MDKTHNNNQVSTVLGSISAETCLKWIIFVVNPPNRQALGALPQTPFRFNG